MSKYACFSFRGNEIKMGLRPRCTNVTAGKWQIESDVQWIHENISNHQQMISTRQVIYRLLLSTTILICLYFTSLLFKLFKKSQIMRHLCFNSLLFEKFCWIWSTLQLNPINKIKKKYFCISQFVCDPHSVLNISDIL